MRSMLVTFLKRNPTENFQTETTNAVEGKVCPDRFFVSSYAVFIFLENVEIDNALRILSEKFSFSI